MLTQSRLKELLSYNPETGLFRWKVSRGGQKKGSVAGYLNPDGYIRIKIDRKLHRAHRLAFLDMESYFPEHEVDHKNGIKNDNRWENLDEKSHSCNMQNQEIRSNNTSGIPGVCWDKRAKKWHACINIPGGRIHLGYYEDLLEAGLARFIAEIEFPSWKCDERNSTLKAIQKIWSEFNPKI